MSTRHLPLDCTHSEIRLLEVFPLNGQNRLTPSCRTFRARLTDRPRFTALSYVWGDSTQPKRVMIVDDAPVEVMENLYDAVIALRLPDGSIVIWIDFLCIDQSNDHEKSRQVELMRDIYGEATKVYIWLGPSDDDSDQVIKFLDDLGRRAELCGIEHAEGYQLTVWQDILWNSSRDWDKFSKRDVKMSDGSIKSVPYRQVKSLFHAISGWHDQDNLFPVIGMQRLFARPWWGRIWVLQEIALPRSADFVCGNRRISRSRCDAAMAAYVSLWTIIAQQAVKDISALKVYHLTITTSLFHHRPNIMLSSRRISKYEPFSLAALLRLTCVGSENPQHHGPHHLQSTDPRDKVYALLSLASDRDELGRQGILPDYTKSCADIYTSTMAVLLSQGHISLLSLCHSPHQQLGLPSWVPDWSQPVMAMLQDVENDHIMMYPPFAAPGPGCHFPKVFPIKFKKETKTLVVSGKLYDVVEGVVAFRERASGRKVPISEILSWPRKWLMEILRLTYRKQCFVNFKQRLCAAVRTSIADVGHDENARLARVGNQRTSDAMFLLEDILKLLPRSQMKLDIEQFLLDGPVRETSDITSGLRLCSEINTRSLGRAPFITKKGHLGLSSEMVEQGDVIALIEGSQVPFALRRQQDGTYRLVHEAYVDGIMDGEAARSSRLRNISLC